MLDNQKKVDVTVYQGEDPDALNNIEIGRFTVEGLRDAPAGNPIVLEFSLDLNGLLNVTAREKESGLACSITIDNAIARFAEDKLGEARQRVQALFGEKVETNAPTSEAGGRRLRVEAQALVEKAERAREKAGAEDAEDLVDGIEAVRDAMAGEDDDALQTAMDGLADLLYHLES